MNIKSAAHAARFLTVKVGTQSFTVDRETREVFAHVMSAPKGTGYCVRMRRFGPKGAQARAALAQVAA